MLPDIIRDFGTIISTFQQYGGVKENIPAETMERNRTLAGKVVLQTACLLTGYRERDFKAMSGRDVLLHLIHIRADMADELEGAGLTFQYLYDDGIIVGRLVDVGEDIKVTYPLTTAVQAKEIGELRWMIEFIPSAVH